MAEIAVMYKGRGGSNSRLQAPPSWRGQANSTSAASPWVCIMNSHARKENKLFQPLAIANGRIQLKHRIVYTPLIRLRGLPIIDRQDDNAACTAYYPDILHAEYYGQRANESGLLISEGIPPSMQVCLRYSQGYPTSSWVWSSMLGHRSPFRTSLLSLRAGLGLEESHRCCACEERLRLRTALA